MKRHSVIFLCVGVLALLAGAGGAGFWLGRHHEPAAKPEASDSTDNSASTEPVASVQTVALIPSSITESVVAYGTVVSDQANQQTVTAPYEGRVLRILVQPGAQLTANQAVAEIEPSPDVKLAFEQAKNAVEAAKRDLANTQERFDLKLATNQELQASQNALRDATLKLEDLRKRGSTENQLLKARAPGTVIKADVTVGQIVPAGGPVMEIDDPRPSFVKLGVDAQDAQRLKIGATVTLTQVGHADAAPVEGRIHLIPPRINPDTRLVDVLVSLPADTRWLMGSFVDGKLVIGSKKETLVVPRAAVLPTDEGQRLFTLDGGKAVAHTVTIGLQTDREYEIAEAKPPLHPGDPVVLSGNYELDDGMAVATRPAP